MAVSVLCPLLAVSWVSLKCVIVAYPLTLLFDKVYNTGISFFLEGGGGGGEGWGSQGLKFGPYPNGIIKGDFFFPNFGEKKLFFRIFIQSPYRQVTW